MSKAKRKEKIEALSNLFGVLNAQAPGSGDALREVLHDVSDAAGEPTAKAKPKKKARA